MDLQDKINFLCGGLDTHLHKSRRCPYTLSYKMIQCPYLKNIIHCEKTRYTPSKLVTLIGYKEND